VANSIQRIQVFSDGLLHSSNIQVVENTQAEDLRTAHPRTKTVTKMILRSIFLTPACCLIGNYFLAIHGQHHSCYRVSTETFRGRS